MLLCQFIRLNTNSRLAGQYPAPFICVSLQTRLRIVPYVPSIMNPQQSYPSLRSQGKLPAKGRRNPRSFPDTKSLILWSVNPNAATQTNALPSLPLPAELSSGEDREVFEERTPHSASESPNTPQNEAGRDSQAMVEGQARQGRTDLHLFLIHKLLIL